MELLASAVDNQSLMVKVQEKHLVRPPFSLIHRILQSVVQNGFAPNYFSPAELAEIEDKELKIVILNKITNYVKNIDSSFNWDISKVLSGKEEQNTNLKFFQLFSYGVLNKIPPPDSTPAVAERKPDVRPEPVVETKTSKPAVETKVADPPIEVKTTPEYDINNLTCKYSILV